MGTQTRQRSAEERAEQAKALHASIVEQVQQLADSGEWRRFLDFARSFHSYSLNNLLLILAQHPDATMVAGFRQWQAKGRQVRKGAKSIKIFGFREQKTIQPDDDNDATESGGTADHPRRYFPILSVFDITQTDPIDGAEPLPENPTRNLEGADDHDVLEPLTAHLEGSGWAITREPLAHANGYTDPDRHLVVLGAGLGVEQEAKTLIHEAAHIQLEHVNDLDEYQQHRGRMEVEAESVAYIVAGLTGFDSSAYSIGYITGWANEDLDLIRDTAGRVLKAAHTLYDAIES
ncbi:ArdC-like ssDNA-binding domain-containing protein [Diaminobutyricibacter sp. McL0618]|uniref:ArdC family protein n=1 Tax=Leifsonia sp. McL0618 TaxID=3415677 RepID=UPI003CFB590D